MQADPGQIVVERPDAAWRDRVRRYVVKIDGTACGKVGPGGRLVLPVPPGHHTVQARIDWAGSPVVDVEVGGGEKLRFIVAPGGKAWQFHQAFTRRGRRYLTLTPE